MHVELKVIDSVEGTYRIVLVYMILDVCRLSK